MTGFLPAAFGVPLFDLLYVIDSRVRSRRLALRLIALLMIWLGAFAQCKS